MNQIEGNHQSFWDIETGALPKEQIEAMIPEFNQDDVKLGNLKDPVKIAEKIEAARQKHRQDFFDRAALDPMTGCVIAIGYLDNETNQIEIDAVDAEKCNQANMCPVTETIGEITVRYYDSEKKLLEAFIERIRYGFTHSRRFVGFNNFTFDLGFVMKRCWHHGIKVPRLHFRNGRYWQSSHIDLRELWQCGDWKGGGTLDAISKFFGFPGKSGNGKFFEQIYAENRGDALNYLATDLRCTQQISHRMGFAAPDQPEEVIPHVAPTGDY